jgi:hypothetical protein
MDIEKVKSKLMGLGIEPHEMYSFPSYNGRQLLIVRRTGIEKLERAYNIQFKYLSVTESSFGRGCNVTVVLQGECKVYDPIAQEAKVIAVQAMGSANPETVTKIGFMSDMANKRARHKVVLKIADLYQYDVHSEEESEDFKPTKQFDHTNAFQEAMKKISI